MTEQPFARGDKVMQKGNEQAFGLLEVVQCGWCDYIDPGDPYWQVVAKPINRPHYNVVGPADSFYEVKP